MSGDLGQRLYSSWCAITRQGTLTPPPWGDLSPLERDAWRGAADSLRRGLVSDVMSVLGTGEGETQAKADGDHDRDWPPPMRDVWVDGVKNRLPGPWCHTGDNVKARLDVRPPGRLYLEDDGTGRKTMTEITGDAPFEIKDGQRFKTTLY